MPDFKLKLFEVVNETEIVIKGAEDKYVAKTFAGRIPKKDLKWVPSKYRYIAMDAEIIN